MHSCILANYLKLGDACIKIPGCINRDWNVKEKRIYCFPVMFTFPVAAKSCHCQRKDTGLESLLVWSHITIIICKEHILLWFHSIFVKPNVILNLSNQRLKANYWNYRYHWQRWGWKEFNQLITALSCSSCKSYEVAHPSCKHWIFYLFWKNVPFSLSFCFPSLTHSHSLPALSGMWAYLF